MPKSLNNSNPTTMEELLASSTQKTLDLTRGQEVEGEVILITDKEVVLDLGAKSEAVIPIREIQKPGDIKIGDKLKGFVVEVDNESNQIILSIARSNKPAEGNQRGRPESNLNWDKITEKYTDGIVKGTVTKVTQFGVFVQLEEGLEGLIHISKLGPDDDFKPGTVLSVSVDSIDADKKRLALSPVITSTKGLMYK